MPSCDGATALRSRRACTPEFSGATCPIRARSLLSAAADMRILRAVVLAPLFAGLLVQSATAAAADPTSFLCAPARVEQDGSAPADLALADRFVTRSVTVAKASSVCWAAAPGSGTLEGYGLPSKNKKSR